MGAGLKVRGSEGSARPLPPRQLLAQGEWVGRLKEGIRERGKR